MPIKIISKNYDAQYASKDAVDSHLADTSNPHSVTAAQAGAAPAAEGVTGGNAHDHSGGDGGPIAHSSLSGVGTLTHTELETKIGVLENATKIYEVFKIIPSGTTGTITKPTGSTILLDRFEGAVDALVVEMDSNSRPVDAPVYTAAGALVTATFDASGNYTFSGTPSAYPVALVYQVSIATKDSGNIPASEIVTEFDTVEWDEIGARPATLVSLGGLGTAADRYFYTTAVGALAEGVISSDARTMLAAANNAAIRSAIGLGTIATQAEGNYALLAGRAGGQTLKGGSAITDILKLQGTSGNGTLTSPAIQALVGNNGATVAWTVFNNGNVGIGTTSPLNKLDVRGSIMGGTNNEAITNGYYTELDLTHPTNSSRDGMRFVFKNSGIIFTTQVVSVFGTNDLFYQANTNSNDSYFAFEAYKSAGLLFLTGGASDVGVNKPIIFAPERIEAMRIAAGGNVGIGRTSPTAVLHLKAGTATANTAPLKLTSGTLNTTAEAGAIEFLTDDFYATITTGAARKKIVLTSGLTSGDVPYITTNGRLLGQTPVANGTYTTGIGGTTNGTITITNGVITAIQQAVA